LKVDRSLIPTLGAFALLSAWIGAAIVVAVVVAPAAFAVLPSRTMAGALVGRVLPVLFWSGALVGLLSALLTWSLPGRTARSVSVLALVVACGAAQLVVAPRIERIRAAVTGPMDSLEPGDERRVAFGRLHGASVGLLGVAALAALAAAVLIVRSVASRTHA
jgi:hypothetical protein